MCESGNEWYIHDLLEVLNNPTKFKLNRIRTYNFQLQLFDTAVTLKSSQGHSKDKQLHTIRRQAGLTLIITHSHFFMSQKQCSVTNKDQQMQ